MGRSGKGWYYLFFVSSIVSGAVVAARGALVTVDPAKYSIAGLAQVVDFCKSYSWAFLGLLLYAPVGQFAAKRIGAPWVDEALGKLLETARTQIHPKKSSPKKDSGELGQMVKMSVLHERVIERHRVTVFKHCHWNWRTLNWERNDRRQFLKPWIWRRLPRSKVGWLKPYARSGHTATQNVSWFKVFDRTRVGEGVAGSIWHSEDVSRIPNLPNICPDASPKDKDFEHYARETGVTVEWLKSRGDRNTARCYYGTRIDIAGKPWGVVLIDSAYPDLTMTDDQLKMLAAALGTVLSRA